MTPGEAMPELKQYYFIEHRDGRWGVYKTHSIDVVNEPFAWFDEKEYAISCRDYYRNLPAGTEVGRMRL